MKQNHGNYKNYKKIIKLNAVLLFLFFSTVLAAFAEVRTITISNAVELALANNLQIRQMESDLRAAEFQYNQSFADFWLPNIDLTGTFTIIDQQSVSNSVIYGLSTNATGSIPVLNSSGIPTGEHIPFPSLITNYQVSSDNYSAGLSITKPLFAGFRLWNAMETRRLNVELMKIKLSDKRKEIQSSVQTSFYQLFVLQANIQLTESLLKSTKERLEYTRNKYDSGYIAEYDAIRAEVQYENTLPALSKLTNNFFIARKAFFNMLEISNTDNLDVMGNLMDATNVAPEIATEDAAEQLALSNDISIISMDFNLKMNEFGKKISEGNKYPMLNAFFNYKYDYKHLTMLDTERSWVPGWNTGVQLTIPIDDWIPISHTENTIKEADASIEKLNAARKSAVENILLSVQTLWLQIEDSRNTMESLSHTMKRAKQGADLANERYRQGIASAIEVTDAESSYNQAAMSYYQAVFDYYSGVIKLRKMTGRL